MRNGPHIALQPCQAVEALPQDPSVLLVFLLRFQSACCLQLCVPPLKLACILQHHSLQVTLKPARLDITFALPPLWRRRCALAFRQDLAHTQYLMNCLKSGLRRRIESGKHLRGQWSLGALF